MAVVKQFKLPDAGEGLIEADIVAWRVQVGDTVALNDPIVEIETAKALVELPCPYAGVVTEIHAPAGATVVVGTPIISVDTDPGGPGEVDEPPQPLVVPEFAVGEAVGSGVVGSGVAGSGSAVPGVAEPAASLVGKAPAADRALSDPAPVATSGRTAVLVGYGPRTGSTARRPRRPAADRHEAEVLPARTGGTSGSQRSPLAKPPVRLLARQLGVDLGDVPASGPGGVVTRDDVQRAAARLPVLPVPGSRQARVGPPDADPDARPSDAPLSDTPPSDVPRADVPRADTPRADPAQPAGPGPGAAQPRETRVPVRGVRKLTAEAMVASAFTAPHVTEWVQVDVSRSMKLLDRLRTDRAFDGVKVSPLLLVAKALLVAVQRNPQINATWHESGQEIVVKHYVNLGIAAATPRGLVVPNVRDADRLGLRDLAVALNTLAGNAREGRTAPADLRDGTITITNVGVFGIDGGTPILNPGEAAILAVGRIRRMPWVHKGKVRPRWVTTLALSFDHRMVDGDLGSRVLAEVAGVLEDPARALL